MKALRRRRKNELILPRTRKMDNDDDKEADKEKVL